MQELLEQIKKGLDEDLYYLSLFSVLALPDLCGAMDSNDGRASEKKFIKWFDEYVAPKYSGFVSGNDCYYFRCSLLHQGSSQHPKNTYDRVIFIEPSKTTNTFHNNVINNALNIDLKIFCNDIVEGVEKWLKKNEDADLYQQNYDKFMRRYPHGLSPYIVGISVIS